MRRRLPLAAIFGLAALLAACGKDQPPAPPPPTVGVVTLKNEPVTLTTELPGRIVAFETSEVRPQVSGVVRRRLFAEGANVRAGQVLYEIEDAPYRAALGQAQGAGHHGVVGRGERGLVGVLFHRRRTLSTGSPSSKGSCPSPGRSRSRRSSSSRKSATSSNERYTDAKRT